MVRNQLPAQVVETLVIERDVRLAHVIPLESFIFRQSELQELQERKLFSVDSKLLYQDLQLSFNIFILLYIIHYYIL